MFKRPQSFWAREASEFTETHYFKHGKSRQVMHPAKFAPKFNLTYCDFSPDGLFIATCSEDKSCRIWDLTTKKQLRCFEHGDFVISCSFSPNGKRMCTGAFDGCARVFDIEDDTTEIIKLELTKAVFVCSYSPCMRFLLTTSWDKKARIWYVEEFPDRPKLEPEPIVTFQYADEVLSARFCKDGERLCTACGDCFVRIHAIPEPPEFHEEGEEPDDDDDAPKFKTLDLTKMKVDMLKERLKKRGLPTRGRKQDLIDRLMDCGGDKTPVEPPPDPERELACFEHPDKVLDARFNADGKWLVTACRDKKVRVINIVNSNILIAFYHGNMVRTVDISPDSTSVLTACDDGRARIYDLVESQEIQSFDTQASVTCACFNPEGTKVCTSSKTGAGQVWGVPLPPEPEESAEAEEAVEKPG
eukprot:TRINITY_DN24045_c0_g2_i1.p1 TRINITY_DN24045_c0_g2~~TRINITY_DN24045_c0_g2_i1.p1  ORF type:complete len:415 (-),score=98.31 TRINITY_DN24045_c0_g2_i1:2-1246(-)